MDIPIFGLYLLIWLHIWMLSRLISLFAINDRPVQVDKISGLRAPWCIRNIISISGLHLKRIRSGISGSNCICMFWLSPMC